MSDARGLDFSSDGKTIYAVGNKKLGDCSDFVPVINKNQHR